MEVPTPFPIRTTNVPIESTIVGPTFCLCCGTEFDGLYVENPNELRNSQNTFYGYHDSNAYMWKDYVQIIDGVDTDQLRWVIGATDSNIDILSLLDPIPEIISLPFGTVVSESVIIASSILCIFG